MSTFPTASSTASFHLFHCLIPPFPLPHSTFSTASFHLFHCLIPPFPLPHSTFSSASFYLFLCLILPEHPLPHSTRVHPPPRHLMYHTKDLAPVGYTNLYIISVQSVHLHLQLCIKPDSLNFKLIQNVWADSGKMPEIQTLPINRLVYIIMSGLEAIVQT